MVRHENKMVRHENKIKKLTISPTIINTECFDLFS